MWLYKAAKGVVIACSLLGAACTVEPLHGARSDGAISNGSSVTTALSGASVTPANTRVGQQVRNNLLFAMGNRGTGEPNPYTISLTTTSRVSNLAIEGSSVASIAAKATVTVIYKMTDTKGKIVAAGKRSAFGSFDKTPQSFANERAALDAENRAAKEVAQQVYLALTQAAAS